MNTAGIALKEVGKKLFQSKWFWYIIIFFVGYKILKKTFPALFVSAPPEVVLPDSDRSPALTQTWWNQIGKPAMLELRKQLGDSWYSGEIFSPTKRDAIFKKLLNMDKAQLTMLYNEFNKNYSVKDYEGDTMTQVIDSQWNSSFWIIFTNQDDLVDKLISYNLQ